VAEVIDSELQAVEMNGFAQSKANVGRVAAVGKEKELR
jgi:hypothetical protein